MKKNSLVFLLLALLLMLPLAALAQQGNDDQDGPPCPPGMQRMGPPGEGGPGPGGFRGPGEGGPGPGGFGGPGPGGPPPPPMSREERALDTRARQLAAEYARASDAQKPALKQQLHHVLDELFSMRQQNMQRHIERQQADLKAREAHRNDIIDRHMADLLGNGLPRW